MRDGECAKCGGNMTTDHRCPEIYQTRVKGDAVDEISRLKHQLAAANERSEKLDWLLSLTLTRRERELQADRDKAEARAKVMREALSDAFNNMEANDESGAIFYCTSEFREYCAELLNLPVEVK